MNRKQSTIGEPVIIKKTMRTELVDLIKHAKCWEMGVLTKNDYHK